MKNENRYLVEFENHRGEKYQFERSERQLIDMAQNDFCQWLYDTGWEIEQIDSIDVYDAVAAICHDYKWHTFSLIQDDCKTGGAA